MDSLETAVLAAATTIIAVAALTILWRELSHTAQGGFLQRWRDYVGIGATLGGLAFLVTWLWVS